MTREDPIAALAALAEPLRRRLYLWLSAEGEPISREAAAAALGVSRSVAAFHLDKLAELGLLEVDYRRPAGRSGPGAGRPTKFYRRAESDVAFSVPERHYDVAASLLAEALERSGSAVGPEALRSVARGRGRAMGRALLTSATAGSTEAIDRDDLVARLVVALGDHGYEPRVTGELVTLENCPFRNLADRHRDLICGMNRALVAGVLEGLGAPETVEARLDPSPGRCCVTVQAG